MKWERCFILSGLFILFFRCAKQDDFSVLKSPYLGQKPPGDTAVVFAPGIVTTDQHEHSQIQFSINGTEMFWAVIPIDKSYQTTGGSPFKHNEQNIWYSKIIHDEWTIPTIFDITKIRGGSSPAFSADGDMFYYRSPKPDADPNIRPRPSQLWKVSYDKGQWGEPIPENDLFPNEEGKTFMSFCFSKNGNLYFDYGGPDETGKWWWSIYFSEFKDGGYLTPVKMGHGINDSEASWCPWIAPDESYIIYSSHREGELGRGDLYINFMNDRGNWSNPINMGVKVNTEMQERFSSVSPDGKLLFFARHLPETFSDIFWVDAKIIEDLKPKELK